MDIVSDIILVVAVVIVYVVFPLWAAHHASRRGHKRWAKIAVLSTLLGLGLFGGLAALWAARKSVEEPESQPKTEADRIRSRGRTLALVASVGITLAVGAVMVLTVVVPMSDRALEQSMGDPGVSAIESMEAMSSASSLSRSKFHGIGTAGAMIS
jgi:NADH:ubiquinone oxidoreductase subunit 6 (subunit J)